MYKWLNNEYFYFAVGFGFLGITLLLATTQMLNRTGVEADRIRAQLDTNDQHNLAGQQFALLKEYHSQGIAQSQTSFRVSMLFASVGFIVILCAIALVLAERSTNEPTANLADSKPVFVFVAGVVIEAVGALFFAQSNRARKLMTEFFDKLRIDRKLDYALNLSEQIEEVRIKSRLRAVLALQFAEVEARSDLLSSILGHSQKQPSALADTASNRSPEVIRSTASGSDHQNAQQLEIANGSDPNAEQSRVVISRTERVRPAS